MIKPLAESKPAESPETGVRWSLPARIGFRFVFSYLVLYLLYLLDELYFFLYFMPARKDTAGLLSPLWHVVVPWFGKHILHLGSDITIFSNSSADTTYDFVLVFFHLVLAAVAAVAWSILDRRRMEYRKLHQWLRLAVQFLLAAMMAVYGTDKLIPLQFGNLTLSRLVRTVGEMSPITLLWTFMSASTLYTAFAGFAEVLGGVLLLFRRTVTLGALISFAAMCNVLALNLGYDVPVKLQTFHFILLAAFLLVPDIKRLSNFFLFNQTAEPRCDVPLSKSAWINSAAWRSVSVLGLLVLCWLLFFGYRLYSKLQADVARQGPLYGVWDVDEFTVTKTNSGPLFTERLQKNMHIKPGHEAWQRLLFESTERLIIQVEGPVTDYVRPKLDEKNGSLTITDDGDPKWICKLTFQRPDTARLLMQGDVNGTPISLKLHREDDSRFVLTSRGFHLISEHAFFN